MKRSIDLVTFQNLHYRIQQEIFSWQKNKGYPYNPRVTLDDTLEYLMEESRNLHKEVDLAGELDRDSKGSSYYSFLLKNAESLLAWEGEELVDILFYEMVEVIKKRLSHP